MANNYGQFSFTVPCPSTEAKDWLVKILGMDPEDDPENALILEEIGFDVEYLSLPSWEYHVEPEGGVFWFHGDEGVVDGFDELLQRYVRMFMPNGSIGYGVAWTCSKPRVGEFGGVAVFITAQDVRHMSTDQWITEQRNMKTHDRWSERKERHVPE